MINLTTLPKSQQRKVFLLLAAFIFAFIALVFSNAWLSLDQIQNHTEPLRQFIEKHFWFSLIISGLLYTLATALSFPGCSLLSLLVGFLYGRWLGTAIIVFSATLGAVFVFLIARHLVADWAIRRLYQHPLSSRMITGFQYHASHYLLCLRLVPLFPFWLVNLIPAVTGISLSTYTLTTFLGIIPGSFVFANLGQSLNRIESLDALLSTEIFLALSLLGLLALAPLIVKRYTLRFKTPNR